MDKRKLQIISRAEMPLDPQHLTCFVRRLSADLCRRQPIYTWLPDKEAGTDAFYAIGLSEGSVYTLRTCSAGNPSGVVMSHFRNDVLLDQATEIDGSPTTPGHLACLYKLVAATNPNPRR